MSDQFHQQRTVGVARDDRGVSPEIGGGGLEGIESKPGLSSGPIRAMTEEAAVGKDRANVPTVSNLELGPGGSRHGQAGGCERQHERHR